MKKLIDQVFNNQTLKHLTLIFGFGLFRITCMMVKFGRIDKTDKIDKRCTRYKFDNLDKTHKIE